MLGVTCSTVGATCPKGTSIPPKPSTKSNRTVSTFPTTLLNRRPEPPLPALGRFMGTRAFKVYAWVVIHGVAMSAFEICAQTVPSRISDEDFKVIPVNMFFFTAANLIVIWWFSWVRYYVHERARLAETFIILSILSFIVQIPLLAGFIGPGSTYAKQGPSTKPDEQLDDYGKGAVVIIYTIFHSTVFFWIFTGGPLTFFVSTNILGGDEIMKAAGVPAILAGFAVVQVVPGVLSLAGQNVTGTYESTAIFVFCIATQTFTLLFFKPYDYSWNKKRWFNYFILIMTGVSNTFFLSYTYIWMGKTAGKAKAKMAAYGPFYAVMGFVVSRAMGIMFRSFNADEIRRFGSRNIHYCFPTVYKGITIIFMLVNAIAAAVLIVLFFTSPRSVLPAPSEN